MKDFVPILLAVLLTFAGCGPDSSTLTPAIEGVSGVTSSDGKPKPSRTLTEARRGFRTNPTTATGDADPLPEPPGQTFQLIRYDSPAGKLAAYLSPDPNDGQKKPAIVWITGGDCNSIGELWNDRPRENDQSAAAYRKAGIVMMFPSLRGGNDNPGHREGFFGEVDDVLAAADHLAHLDYVDPNRIYLGGHSTGGTLVMLVAESTDRFRGVFSFGPVDDVSGYGPEYLPFNARNAKEVELRSPGRWLDSVRSPLFVLEGTESPGNLDSLNTMAQASRNPLIHFLPVKGVSHFSILAPVNEIIAAKIVEDKGAKSSLSLSEADLASIQP